jgi:MraZ protein
LDEKGRFLFPSSLRRLLTEAEQEEFVLNLNPKGYLDLYPLNRWEKKLEEIFSLNQYIQENRDYARRFQSGATPVQMDKAGRIQVPKALLAFAGMDADKSLVIKGMGEVFELWTETRHAQWLNSQNEDLNQMGERLMGNRPPQNPNAPGFDPRFPMN